ncbi:hypothetical protein BaRGS_00002354 [Batillaria attramentaria]|uniref:Arylesterase n=1 Tax=Batillaria attramentaria TaxID=370345 RepID=A0ABD0M3M9_9CAEN
MLSKGTAVKIVAVALLAAAVQHIVRLAIVFGFFWHHHPHYPGPCRKVDGIQLGSEGFHTLPDGLTFITSGLRLQTAADGVEEFLRTNNIKGRMYLFDFRKSDAGAKELKLTSTKQFNRDTFFPHGMSVWEDKKSGHHIVFVVNHALEEPFADRIEKFIYNPEKQELEHQASYSDESMRIMNDVQATGETSFYFTNSQYFRTKPLGMLEIMLQLELTDVVYFDGNKYKVVADGMKVPNGIAMSNDQRYLYVAACTGEELRVFKRNTDNSLTLQQVLPVGSLADNPLVDPKTGDVYLASHPVGYKALAHLDDPTLKTPSQVLHFRVKDGNITSAQELLYDDGDLISGSSTAMVYDGKLLVGSVHHNLILCDGVRQQAWGHLVDEYFRINKIKGRLYLFDFRKSEQGAKELKISSTDQFNLDTFYPHGISVWEDKKSGRHTVFVVNHPQEEPVADRIEKFVYNPEKQELEHQASYSDKSMKVINDVQATGTNSFYFTNYQYFTSKLGRMLETLMEMSAWMTDVVYFDGSVYRTVADGMKSPNGIAMSNDGQYIYIAPCLGREIRVFKRSKDNSLTLQQIYPVHTVADNVHVDPKTGDVYTGCHPIGYKIMSHLEDPLKHTSPSQVLHLRVKDGNITSAQELLYDEGELISASTSAMVYDRKLLVGSIFHNLVLCDVNIPM